MQITVSFSSIFPEEISFCNSAIDAALAGSTKRPS
jgi:hypothetical protein